jgi:hypothetical protein
MCCKRSSGVFGAAEDLADAGTLDPGGDLGVEEPADGFDLEAPAGVLGVPGLVDARSCLGV